MTMKNDVCGIYMIENKKTKQRYIGQSIHIYQRWNEHINQPTTYMRIDRAIKKHGADNFELKVICELEQDDDLLNEMEKYYIWKYNTYENDFHYNLTPGGDFSPMKVPEIAAKISGENHPMKNPEARAKISGENHPMYGKKGEEHPWFGCKHTPEAKAKISKAHFGKKHSEETRKKISKAHKGKELSKEHRKKISEVRKGKKLSKEHRKKISKAQNTTGYYRVVKSKNPQCRQGFYYRYQYYDDNGKQHRITSVSLEKLEKKVKAKGLEWLKMEE